MHAVALQALFRFLEQKLESTSGDHGSFCKGSRAEGWLASWPLSMLLLLRKGEERSALSLRRRLPLSLTSSYVRNGSAQQGVMSAPGQPAVMSQLSAVAELWRLAACRADQSRLIAVSVWH